MPLNSALERKTYPETTFTVDAKRVARFREALGDERDDVPPTFATAAEFTVFPAIVSDPELGLDFTRVVHAEQEYEWRRPLRVGETLTVRTHIASIRKKAGTGFLTIRSELVGADGAVAVLAWATLIERSA